MRALITGVAGFIGSSLADQLLADGHEVIGVDCFTSYYEKDIKVTNLESAKASSSFRFFESDLRTCNLNELLDGVDTVFHQAGQPGVRASWGAEFADYVTHNVTATQRLLEACRDKSDLVAFVAASSSSVYGTAERYPTNENDLPRPISPYGVTKLAAEHLCSLYGTQFGIPTTSLRYFTVYGPRQRPDMAMTRLVLSALQGTEFSLYGTGEQKRDFTFIADVVRANISVANWLANGGTPGSVFNVGNCNPTVLQDVIRIIEDATGKTINLKKLPRQDGDPMQTGADCSLIESAIGWRAETKIEDGLAAQVSYFAERSK